MKVQLITGPTIEPISLAELKLHLRLDSGSFADNIDENQSISPGDHIVAAAYSLVGTGVDVLGYTAVVVLNSGTNGATGTVDVKIQESDDNVTYTDWATGAFTQVTTANDNAIQEMAYTGTKQYIRTVATVALATCDFSATVIRLTATSVEDDDLTEMIKSARLDVENDSRRQLITATWDYFLDAFPSGNSIKIPFGNLASVTHIKYTDSDGDETEMTVTTDYIVETNGDQCGRIVLPYGVTWPSFTAYPSNPIVIRFICGYGDAASDVPANAKRAIKLNCGDEYTHRQRQSLGQAQIYFENPAYRRLINNIPRLYDEF